MSFSNRSPRHGQKKSLRIKLFQNKLQDDATVGFELPYSKASEESGICFGNGKSDGLLTVPYRSNNLVNSLSVPPSPVTRAQSGTRKLNGLRRAYSAHGMNELRCRSQNNPMANLSRSVSAEFCGDSISAINIPVANPAKKESSMKRDASPVMSGIYALMVTTLGAIIFISEQRSEHKLHTVIFSTVLAVIGISWLVFLHMDIWRYKKVVLKQLKAREDAIQEASERYSTATAFIINSGMTLSSEESDEGNPRYRFLQGRHSGSFYLKIGMAIFCFGDLIYEGLQLGQRILNSIQHTNTMTSCFEIPSITLHLILPVYAFYQLFITFKYSNIVINRLKPLARFGLMHLIATCLCFWFSTIVDEAVEDYKHKSYNATDQINISEFDIASFHITVTRKSNWNTTDHCSAYSVLSTRYMVAIPYLYPFAIEYNLLLAGVWFIVWCNIGDENLASDHRHIRHTISQDEKGSEIAYQSNLVISADCHASNRGLFLGLSFVLATIVSLIIFFVAVNTEGHEKTGVMINTVQEGVLTAVAMVTNFVALYQMRQLNVSHHPITFLDDVLLLVPLPFYFLHGIMSIVAEFVNQNYERMAIHILVTCQVVVQTPFIIDGLRRCSNTRSLRYRKPGREVITFLLIINLTLWIVNTFELKSIEHFHGQEKYFGDLIWMFIGHTTLPFMLFYRFHSSVCLSDIWKSAYEKES